ncbi:MAG: hypothetical protein ACJAY2_001437 [Pseudomonadales bacterium]|jgi:hypothetical protein
MASDRRKQVCLTHYNEEVINQYKSKTVVSASNSRTQTDAGEIASTYTEHR